MSNTTSSPTYTIGTLVVLSVTFTDINGLPADPTTVAIQIQAPDSTYLTPPSITHVSTGIYTCQVQVMQTGIYAYNWAGTGAIEATNPGTFTVAGSVFDGKRPNPIDLTTLDNVKAWLNLPGTNTTSDLLLTQLITQASLFIMNRTGIGAPASGGTPINSPFTSIISVNEWYDGSGTNRQFVRTPPIQSVTAVTINGTNVPAFTTPNSWGFAVDDGGASIAMLGGGAFRSISVMPGGAWGGGGFAGGPFFGSGIHNVNIQYNAGYAITPYDLTQACTELVGYTVRKRQWIGQRSQAMAQAGGSTSYVSWDIAPQVEMIIRSYTRKALV